MSNNDKLTLPFEDDPEGFEMFLGPEYEGDPAISLTLTFRCPEEPSPFEAIFDIDEARQIRDFLNGLYLD